MILCESWKQTLGLIRIFYNVIDMALINSWIIYKHVCNSSISPRMFMHRVSEELTGALQTKGYKL